MQETVAVAGLNPLYVVGGVIVIFILMYVLMYNGLVKARQIVHEAWSGIDVQLKRRYDLIPQLVNTVKGYAQHEKTLLENVTKARTAAMAVGGDHVGQKAQAENMLSGTLKSIFALAENYPDLKANQNFLHLQSQVSETEDQIAAARRIFNGNVTALNTKIESFPSNVVAKMHGFHKEEFFELDEKEKVEVQKRPEISF